MKTRKPKEKFNCVYCGKSTATFCGYWKLISVGRYELKNKSIIDRCYAHLGCYLERHKRIIQLGVHPLAVYCEQIRTENFVLSYELSWFIGYLSGMLYMDFVAH